VYETTGFSEKQFSNGASGIVCTTENQLMAVWSETLATKTTAGLVRFSLVGEIDTDYGQQGVAIGEFKKGFRSAPLGVVLLND